MAGRKQFDVTEALDRAVLTFWEHGYDGASLDVLTRAMGVGRGSFYATFGSKDQLFLAALDRYASRGTTSFPTIRDYFDARIASMLDPDLPDGCLVTQSAALATVLAPAGRAKISEILDRQRAIVTEILTRDGLTGDTLANLTEYVVGIRQALAVLHRSGTGETTLRAIAGLACETVAAAPRN